MPASWLRASARLLVLALSVGVLGPVLHGVHAEDCEPLFVVHDEAAHHFQSAVPDDTPLTASEHCVACHFARSSRGPVSWEPSGLTSFVSGNLLFHSDGHFVAFLFAAPLPARAPPVAAGL
jgi:hypothetical protein